MSALIGLLKHGKRLGMLRDVTATDSGSEQMWCDVIPLSTITAALSHQHDQVSWWGPFSNEKQNRRNFNIKYGPANWVAFLKINFMEISLIIHIYKSNKELL